MTMDYSPCPKREIWPFLKGSHISETGETTPTKTDVHGHGDVHVHGDVHGHRPFMVDDHEWSSKNLINRNRLKKFMQVGVNVTCMYISFGGRGLSGFGDMATFQKRPNFPFGPWTIVHGHRKI